VPELADGVYVHEHNLGSGRPPCDFEDQDDIDRLVSELVDDAYELVFAAEDLGLELDRGQEEAVALLALLAGQDVEQGERPGTWRIAEQTAPDRVISSVDPESRHAHKATPRPLPGSSKTSRPAQRSSPTRPTARAISVAT
jgi:hypothetical protein